MVELPTCAKKELCDMGVRANKKGTVVTAACIACDFVYEVGAYEHTKQKGGAANRSSGAGVTRRAAMYGVLPQGLNIAAVAAVVNGAMDNPNSIQHLASPVIE